MKSRNFSDCCKNAVGTIFLLGGAFLTCSTLLSMRSVLADPIAPMNDASMNGPQATRAGNNVRSGRASPRNNASNTTVARTTTTPVSRATGARNVIDRAASRAESAVAGTASSRTVGTAPARSVRARTTVSPAATRAGNTTSRAVRARNTDATVSRVSHQGSAIRGSKVSANTYSYLSNKLYTGNYSNIVDPTTGLISTDAFNNCMESYYTCMDEICTARNAAQRRCACAGRVKAFAEAETALETANEELIKVSGELALLIASGGEDVSEAFQLTDAEKVMNCVSWRDASKNGTATEEEFGDWCAEHGIFDNSCSNKSEPDYCKQGGNNFGFDVSTLDGNGSDILASLQAWADAKDQTITILSEDEDNLLSAFTGIAGVVGGLAGIDGAFANSEELKDSLAETWGYELFEYAHNNVCARVLDSCFNGIYEACGTPPSGTKCGNGASQCPYNYNSTITVNNTGTYELNFVTANNGYSASNSATCFGYTSASGDPYYNLRGPVADARRSIMQKYALDANADCDAYGEQLRQTAQNIGYQKVAAQQALQQKRLEFAQEKRDEVLAAAVAAGTNFNECISEILDCYETQTNSNPGWPDARIKTYCAQIANVPHCYEEMICNPSTAQFKAVIDEADSMQCLNSQDYTKNTCRNIVTLNEILNTTGSATHANIPAEAIGSSVAMREQCLLDAGVEDVRNWSRAYESMVRCTVTELDALDINAATGYKEANSTQCTKIASCNNGYLLSNGKCILASTDCTSEIENSASATRELLSSGAWGDCELETCKNGYDKVGNACVAKTQECSASSLFAADENARTGTQTWNGSAFGPCVITQCRSGYTLNQAENKCVEPEPSVPDGGPEGFEKDDI